MKRTTKIIIYAINITSTKFYNKYNQIKTLSIIKKKNLISMKSEKNNEKFINKLL